MENMHTDVRVKMVEGIKRENCPPFHFLELQKMDFPQKTEFTGKVMRKKNIN